MQFFFCRILYFNNLNQLFPPTRVHARDAVATFANARGRTPYWNQDEQTTTTTTNSPSNSVGWDWRLNFHVRINFHNFAYPPFVRPDFERRETANKLLAPALCRATQHIIASITIVGKHTTFLAARSHTLTLSCFLRVSVCFVCLPSLSKLA